MKYLMTTFFSCLMLITLCLILTFKVNSYFFDIAKVSYIVNSGTLKINIEKFQIIMDNKTNTNESIEVINVGQLELNSSAIISFVIKDSGTNLLNYDLKIGIAWEKDLSESGKFYIYPENIDDSSILNDIIYNNSSLALIPLINDLNEVNISTDLVKGLNETLDNGILTDLSKSYRFKLFFYQDSQIASDALTFHNKFFELVISANAKSIKEGSNWHSIDKKIAKFICYTDVGYPIINAISQPNLFFITQKSNIDLNSFVNAYDKVDGDLNNQVIITVPNAYDLDKAGIHQILYTVTNSVGNSTSIEIPIVLWDFKKIASGNYHTLALTSHGKVYAWGYNSRGQLGDGTTSYSAIPKLVEGLNNIEIIDVAAGTNCSYALSKDGQIYSWGRNDNGRLGDNTTTDRRTPVKAVQSADVRFIQISARFNVAAALNDKGEVFTWGYSGYGASGNGSAQEDHKPTKINLENIVRVEIGYYNGAAIDNEGNLYTWGDNYHGQLGNGQRIAISYNLPDTLPYFVNNNIKIKDISVGWYHMVGISEEGEVYTWGYGYQGRLGNDSASDKNTPQKISMPEKATKGFAAYYHSAVLTEGQQAYFFGQNGYGKLGTNNTSNCYVPTMLSSYYNITNISLALDTSFILINSQTVYGTGYGGTGILGNNSNSNSQVPISWLFVPPQPEYYYHNYYS